jgi:hypothetical protein
MVHPRESVCLNMGAAMAMGAVVAALRLLPARMWCRALRAATQAAPARRRSSASTRELLRAVDRASGFVPGGRNCLVRALTARLLMTINGRRADVVLGVRKTGAGGLCAHAWLRLDGELVVGGAALEPFAPLPDLGRRL